MTYDIVFSCPEVSGSKISNRPHMGISYLRSYLEFKGFKTNYFRHRDVLSLGEYIELLSSLTTNLYGFSLTDDTLEIFLIIASELRKKIRNCKIIVGGALAKVETAEYLLKRELCDAVIIGEGELACEDFLKAIKNELDIEKNTIQGVAIWNKHLGKLIYSKNTRKIDINSYPSPILSGLIEDRDLTKNGLFSSRGCFHRCIYCSFSANSEWKTQYYDENRFVSEVKLVAEATKKYHPNIQIPIWDDAFTLIKSRAKRILREIIEMDLGVSFWLQTRIDHMDEELVILMKKAGIDHVGIGLESASPKVLKKIRKVRLKDFDAQGYEPENLFLNQFLEFTQLCRRYQLDYTINIIIGLPEETFEDALKTIKFVQSLRPKFYFHNYLRLYTGVPLTRDYSNYGYVINTVNESDSNSSPVNATIVKYNYDVHSVPLLPYRINPLEVAFISGEISELSIDNNKTAILDFSFELYDKLLETDYFNKKQVFKKKPASSHGFNDKPFIKYTLSSVGCYLGDNISSDILSLEEVSLSRLSDYYQNIISEYIGESFDRFVNRAETVLVINADFEKDFDIVSKIANVFNSGGVINLPDNFSSIQFKQIILKDACKFSARCPAQNDLRVFVTPNGDITTCNCGKNLANILEQGVNTGFEYNKIIKKIENERQCLTCDVRDRCSKCIAVPEGLVTTYCELQKKEVRPSSIMEIINYILSQIMDPTNISIFKTSNNRIIVPSKKTQTNMSFLMIVGNQSYYVIKNNSGFEILKISTLLQDSLEKLWNSNDLDILKKQLIDNNYTNEQVEQIVEKVCTLDNRRRN